MLTKTTTTTTPSSWAQALGAALARKRRLQDWQMLTLYWTMQLWTMVLNLSNPSSMLSQLFYAPDRALTGLLAFGAFFVASNVCYVYIWLADPGYVIISLDKQLASVSPPPAYSSIAEKPSEKATETAGLLKRASIPAAQQVAVVINEEQPSTPINATRDANYCYLCDHTIPPRANHCRQCDRCVAKFDHHCPFLNNCVGARTHSVFVAYCFCQSVVMAYAVISLFGLIGFFDQDADPFMNCLYAITGIGCAFLLATSAFLFIGHLALTARNVTTWEYLVSMKIRQQKWRGETVRYAPPGNYDQGCLRNLAEDCSSVPRPEYILATRIVRHNAAWDGADDVEIDTFDAELDSIQPLTAAVHGLSAE